MERGEKRKAQNRRAAQRCRQRKLIGQQSVFENFRWIRTRNQHLQWQINKLNRDIANLKSTLYLHEQLCKARQLPSHRFQSSVVFAPTNMSFFPLIPISSDYFFPAAIPKVETKLVEHKTELLNKMTHKNPHARVDNIRSPLGEYQIKFEECNTSVADGKKWPAKKMLKRKIIESSSDDLSNKKCQERHCNWIDTNSRIPSSKPYNTELPVICSTSDEINTSFNFPRLIHSTRHSSNTALHDFSVNQSSSFISDDGNQAAMYTFSDKYSRQNTLDNDTYRNIMDSNSTDKWKRNKMCAEIFDAELSRLLSIKYLSHGSSELAGNMIYLEDSANTPNRENQQLFSPMGRLCELSSCCRNHQNVHEPSSPKPSLSLVKSDGKHTARNSSLVLMMKRFLKEEAGHPLSANVTNDD